MSEEKTETIETKTEESTESEAVDINVGLVIAERDSLKIELAKANDTIEALTKSLAKATDLIEEDSKAALVNDIAPRTSVDKKVLLHMSIDKLMEMKKVLDVAVIPVFKSGAPMSDSKKTSQKALLESTFDRAQKKRLEGN